jgi:hypothetical protein
MDAFVACLQSGPLRQRRDNRAVIAATSASAILAQRQKDAQGRIIAEIADEALNGGLGLTWRHLGCECPREYPREYARGAEGRGREEAT